MKRLIEVNDTKKVEIEVPPFFKTYCHYYMSNDNGRFTQVYTGHGKEHLSANISDVAIDCPFNTPDEVKPITQDEFYSKLNEAFNILSIGSHKVEEDELNRFSMDREQIEAHR